MPMSVLGVQVNLISLNVAHILYTLNYNTSNGQQVGNLSDSWFCPELEIE